jgi:hypothetical protein
MDFGGNMFLQGDLQAMFDALYIVGAIDPVLKMDWEKITNDMAQEPEIVSHAIVALNKCESDRDKLVRALNHMDTRVVNFVAMEVAREFCEFQERHQLH